MLRNLALRNFRGFNFREYIVCLALRPVAENFSCFLFSKMQTNFRKFIHCKNFNVYTQAIHRHTVLWKAWVQCYLTDARLFPMISLGPQDSRPSRVSDVLAQSLVYLIVVFKPIFLTAHTQWDLHVVSGEYLYTVATDNSAGIELSDWLWFCVELVKQGLCLLS